jgi:hypothetical protein
LIVLSKEASGVDVKAGIHLSDQFMLFELEDQIVSKPWFNVEWIYHGYRILVIDYQKDLLL